LKKWLSFQETGDDFDRDSDTNAEEFSESEDLEDSDGKVFSNATYYFVPWVLDCESDVYDFETSTSF
jgi:hypothetical protein